MLDFIVAMLFGGVLTVGAAATGNLQDLCEKGLKGKYVPTVPSTTTEQCVGGKWSNLITSPK